MMTTEIKSTECGECGHSLIDDALLDALEQEPVRFIIAMNQVMECLRNKSVAERRLLLQTTIVPTIKHDMCRRCRQSKAVMDFLLKEGF